MNEWKKKQKINKKWKKYLEGTITEKKTDGFSKLWQVLKSRTKKKKNKILETMFTLIKPGKSSSNWALQWFSCLIRRRFELGQLTFQMS